MEVIVGWSGGNPAFNDVSTDLIGGHVLQTGIAVSVPGQPQFGGFAAFGEVQQLAVTAKILKHTHHADGPTLRDLEGQIAIDRMGAHDDHEDDAVAGEIASCRVMEAGEE